MRLSVKNPTACVTPSTISLFERENLTFTAQLAPWYSTNPARAPIYDYVCVHLYVWPCSPQNSPLPNDFRALVACLPTSPPQDGIWTGSCTSARVSLLQLELFMLLTSSARPLETSSSGNGCQSETVPTNLSLLSASPGCFLVKDRKA